MLKPRFTENFLEAGCDEAGRGCLAGPVVASAVILQRNFNHPLLNDSKKLSPAQREKMKEIILGNAVAWAVAFVDNKTIDKINILQASFLAMHKAISKLKVKPELLLIDGNRFKPYKSIKHYCIVKGDSLYQSIAAASILAKTSRDEYMMKLHRKHTCYKWDENKGYPTKEHRSAIQRNGVSPFHRRSFTLLQKQKKIEWK